MPVKFFPIVFQSSFRVFIDEPLVVSPKSSFVELFKIVGRKHRHVVQPLGDPPGFQNSLGPAPPIEWIDLSPQVATAPLQLADIEHRPIQEPTIGVDSL